MTEIRVVPRAGVMRGTAVASTGSLLVAGAQRSIGPVLLLGSLLVAGGLLAGCSLNPQPAGASGLRVYAADLGGSAKVCDAPKISPVAAGTSEAPIKLVNDGGWCAIRVRQDGSKPFAAGLLTKRPEHGNILIHEVGDDTRIDYTPDRGFSGSDAFAVKLIPGNVILQVPVTVTAAQK